MRLTFPQFLSFCQLNTLACGNTHSGLFKCKQNSIPCILACLSLRVPKIPADCTLEPWFDECIYDVCLWCTKTDSVSIRTYYFDRHIYIYVHIAQMFVHLMNKLCVYTSPCIFDIYIESIWILVKTFYVCNMQKILKFYRRYLASMHR